MSFYGCSTDPGNFLPDDCNSRNGRVRSVALIKASKYDAFVDFTSLTEWNTAIATGDIIILGNVSGDYPEPSPTEIDATGDADTVTTSFQHQVNFTHKGYVEDNRDFWNVMNTNRNYHIAYRIDGLSDNPIHYISDKPCTIVASPPVEAGLDTEVRWTVHAKWKSVNMPEMYNVPAGLYS